MQEVHASLDHAAAVHALRQVLVPQNHGKRFWLYLVQRPDQFALIECDPPEEFHAPDAQLEAAPYALAMVTPRTVVERRGGRLVARQDATVVWQSLALAPNEKYDLEQRTAMLMTGYLPKAVA